MKHYLTYNITVRQIEVEGENLFEARVRELPDVVEFGETREEAHSLAVDTIETTATIMADRGQQMPEPASVEDVYYELHGEFELKECDEGGNPLGE